MYMWATLPITAMISHLYNACFSPGNNHLNSPPPSPYIIETVAMLERTLNYGHTGSTRVLARSLMDSTWLSIGCIHDGFPALSTEFINHALLQQEKIRPSQLSWPMHATQGPLTTTKRALELTYGGDFFLVRSKITSICSVLYA